MKEQKFIVYTYYRNGSEKQTDFNLNALEMKEVGFSLMMANGNLKRMDIVDGETGEVLITYCATRKVSIEYDNGEF